MKHSLPHLHGLRAILAIMVIFFHTEPFKKYMHWKVLPLKTFAICGDVAVTGFFVLSGFLISYLLLHEQQKNINKENLIAVKKFYWRRILRIWPLYFMIIGLHTYLLPQLHIEDTIQLAHNPFLDKIALHLSQGQIFGFLIFFLPHLLVAMGVLFTPTHVWSIGSEEIFYIFWPWLFRKKIPLQKVIIAIIVIYLVVTYGLFLYVLSQKDTLPFNHPWNVLVRFLYFQRISCMGIGALFAIAFYYKKKIIFGNPKIFYGSVILLSLLLLKGITLPILNSEMYSLLFGIIIYNLVTVRYRFRLLENKMMKYLGDISYGIYMYNPMGVLFSYYINTQVLHYSGWSLSLSYTAMAIAITIALASISYYGVERYFLQWKPS